MDNRVALWLVLAGVIVTLSILLPGRLPMPFAFLAAATIIRAYVIAFND
jgi:galactitol-specific phosphotransferase system IIC component